MNRFKGVDAIRLSQGVIGKTSVVAGIALFGLAILGWQIPDSQTKLIALGAIAGVFLLYFIGVLIFAHMHPDIALLEGSQLIQLRKIEQASKGRAIVKPSRNTAPDAIADLRGREENV